MGRRCNMTYIFKSEGVPCNKFYFRCKCSSLLLFLLLGDGEGGNEMTGSMLLIREFCDRFVPAEKVTRTRIVSQCKYLIVISMWFLSAEKLLLDYIFRIPHVSVLSGGK